MSMKYLIAVCLLLLVFLSACENKTTSSNSSASPSTAAGTLNSEIKQIREELSSLEGQVELLEKRPSEKFMMDLRNTMNLAFKIFHAMDSSDYDYLKLISAPGVRISEGENKVYFKIDGGEIGVSFLSSLNFKNTEYWSSQYIGDDGFQSGFAHFWNDSHSTIYMDFIKKDELLWLFNGFMTNA